MRVEKSAKFEHLKKIIMLITLQWELSIRFRRQNFMCHYLPQ